MVLMVVETKKKKKRERDVTHVPSDVESISHDHLPQSEITTRPVGLPGAEDRPGQPSGDGKVSRDSKRGRDARRGGG